MPLPDESPFARDLAAYDGNTFDLRGWQEWWESHTKIEDYADSHFNLADMSLVTLASMLTEEGAHEREDALQELRKSREMLSNLVREADM